MHNSFRSRSTIRVWEIIVCPLELPHLWSVRWEPIVVVSCLFDRPRWGLQQHYYNNIPVFYTRLTCVYVQASPPPRSTAPSLPCETHPAQRPSIKEKTILLYLMHNKYLPMSAISFACIRLLQDTSLTLFSSTFFLFHFFIKLTMAGKCKSCLDVQGRRWIIESDERERKR